MNPVLIILLFVAACLLWLVCSFLYRPLGKLFGRLIKDAKDEILKEEEKGEKEE
jgi:hypothetical protein